MSSNCEVFDGNALMTRSMQASLLKILSKPVEISIEATHLFEEAWKREEQAIIHESDRNSALPSRSSSPLSWRSSSSSLGFSEGPGEGFFSQSLGSGEAQQISGSLLSPALPLGSGSGPSSCSGSGPSSRSGSAFSSRSGSAFSSRSGSMLSSRSGSPGLESSEGPGEEFLSRFLRSGEAPLASTRSLSPALPFTKPQSCKRRLSSSCPNLAATAAAQAIAAPSPVPPTLSVPKPTPPTLRVVSTDERTLDLGLLVESLPTGRSPKGPSDAPPPASKKRRRGVDDEKAINKKLGRSRRQAKRKALTLPMDPRRLPNETLLARHAGVRSPVPTTLNPTKDAPAGKTGWEGPCSGGKGKGKGKASESLRKAQLLIEVLREPEAKLFEWDGVETVPFVGTNGRVYFVLLGACKDGEWPGVLEAATRKLQWAQKEFIKLKRGRKPRKHDRGRFYTVWTGFTHGGGSTAPHNFKSKSEREDKIIGGLKSDPSIQRIAGWASAGLMYYAPKLFKTYVQTLEEISKQNPHLKFNFRNSIFPGATFNLGPQAVCDEHLDTKNWASGWCSVTAMGNFNYKLGGHLILYDLNLVIEFPPGTTILLPSAVLRHGNVKLLKGEERMSMVQYAAAGLFRWTRSGLTTADSRSSEIAAAMDEEAPSRYEKALESFSRWSELLEDCKVLLR